MERDNLCRKGAISFLQSLKLNEWSIERGNLWKRIVEERESSGAQISTLLNEQRNTFIAEHCDKVSHHEFLAAQAEQDRRMLQEELL